MKTNETVKRHGHYIKIRPGITAIEACDGGLPELRINKNGKEVALYRGSSLGFSDPLTGEDCKYLLALAEGC